ncbi:MAG: Ferrochelatase [Gammaproteobacteria bacterium]|nr:MAG: Ferrochelatase [Gammaproteobacteria bacterium]|tara:strand:+ start:2205 stop:3230 length:1026 start_codon:yes stop_codon:yes gene_type:complete
MNLEKNNAVVVLLVNLGTPKQPNTEEVRLYLKEFLSDKDVIRLPRIFWLPLLHLIILRVRPKKSAELYKKVWTEWGSPLLYNTFLQAGLLRKRFTDKTDPVFLIDVAMRYGAPSLESKILEYKNKDYNNFLILPMFPQYSTTTTKSIANKLKMIMKKNIGLEEQLNIFFIKDFHDNEQYIISSSNQIELFQNKFGKPKRLLLSFHGIPKSYIAEDEPYQTQCFATAKLIAKKLNLNKDSYDVVFQSRFGKAEWIQPYLAETLETLPSENIKDIQVFCPGFVSDCLETIEEIGDESKELFLNSGGQKYNFIPCLNGNTIFIDMLENLIRNYKNATINYKELV